MKEKSTKKSSKEQAIQILSTYIEEKGLRRTPERFALLEHIYSHHGRFDVDKLHLSICENYPVSRATVYNTLELFVACNLIVKHFISSTHIEYERTLQSQSSTNHIICTECGVIKKFTDTTIDKTLRAKQFKDFDSLHHILYMYGTCNKCISIKKQKTVDKNSGKKPKEGISSIKK